jgi:hypothetical protein
LGIACRAAADWQLTTQVGWHGKGEWDDGGDGEESHVCGCYSGLVGQIVDIVVWKREMIFLLGAIEFLV